MEQIGSDVRRELGRFGPATGMSPIVEAWPEAVGSAIATNAWPARLARDGTLYVFACDSVWAFELNQQAAAILERMRAALDEGVPKALRFIPGPLPEAAVPEREETAAAPPEPTQEALRQAAQLTAGIGDEELRQRVERAVALSLSRPPSGRSLW